MDKKPGKRKVARKPGNLKCGEIDTATFEQKLNDYSEILGKSTVYMYVSDLDTHEVLFMNNAVCNAYGETGPGRKCHEIFEHSKTPCKNCMNDFIRKTRMPHTWDYFDNITKRHYLSTAQIIRWHDGRDVRFETSIDITDQKNIERLLQASEDKYRSLIEQSSYGYFILNTQGEVTYLNDVAEKMYGMKLKSVVGQKLKLTDLLNTNDAERASAILSKLHSGESFHLKIPAIYNITRSDGKTRTIEVQTFPIMRDGNIVGFHGTVVDITERVKAEMELKEKSSFLDAVFNNASDGIFVVDEDLKYVMINPASGKILSHDPKEWIGKRAGTFKHPEDARSAAEAVMKVINGEPASCEVRVQASDGVYHLLHIRYNSMYLDEKFHVMGMVTDITESRKAELALKESEQKYRALYNQAVDGIILMPINQETLVVNNSFALMHGYDSPEEMSHLRLQDIDSPDSSKLVPERLRRLLAGEELTFEVEHYHKDGHTFPVLVKCKVIDIEGVPHYMGFHHDITQQKKSEQALIASEDKYRSLFENSPEAVLILGNEGRIIECNKATSGLFELEHKKMIGRRVDELGILDPAQSESYRKWFVAMTNGNEMNNRDVELIFGDGHSKWVEIIPSMIARAGEFYGVQMIARDITERKLRDIDLRKKLLRFNIDHGNVYLSKEPRASRTLEAFKELLMVGHEGVIISRMPKANYGEFITYMFNHVTVSETTNENHVNPNYKSIRLLVFSVPRRHVIHIDCIEYLISRIGSQKTIAFVQYLKDLAVAKDLVVLISIDPKAITEKDLRLIEMESREILPCQSLMKLSEKLMEILKLIDDMNREGKMPSYSDISEHLKISKPTARNRISQLTELGAVKEKARGRKKILELTKTGKNYLVV